MKKFLLSTLGVLPILCLTAFASPLSGLFPNGIPSTDKLLWYGFLCGIGISLLGALFLCIAFLKPSSKKEAPIESPFDVYMDDDSEEPEDDTEEDTEVESEELPESDSAEEPISATEAEDSDVPEEIDSEPEIAPEVEPEPEPKVEADLEVEAELEVETEPDTESEVEATPEVEAEIAPAVEPEEDTEDETVYPKLILTNTTTNDFVILPLYPETKVGRKTDNDLVLSDVTISGLHCKILNEDGSVSVVDENSTNGTFINGDRISEKTELHHGDKLLIGKQEFNVSIRE